VSAEQAEGERLRAVSASESRVERGCHLVSHFLIVFSGLCGRPHNLAAGCAGALIRVLRSDEAVANHALLGNQLWQEGMEDQTERGAGLRREVGARIAAAKIREFNSLGVVLGYRYDDSPVIVGDATQAPPRDFLKYVPSGRPGCLAPHAWLHDGTSLYDHFGQGFTLLVTDGSNEPDVGRAREAAQMADVPLQITRPLDGGLHDLYQARYALIRPDQHVAWRGNACPEDAMDLLLRVTGRVSARRHPTRQSVA
jgi:hypothetical protein